MNKFKETKKWQTLEKKVLNKNKNTCKICGATNTVTVDHIADPKYHKQLIYKETNLHTVCERCKEAFHTKFKHSYRCKTTQKDWDRFIELYKVLNLKPKKKKTVTKTKVK